MEITLTNKVDELRKVYTGEARGMEGSRITCLKTLILAQNSEEARAKLLEYTIQEYPSMDSLKIEYRISVQVALT